MWALELLLLLKSEPRGWPRAELVAAMRASELVVARALDALVAAGMVSLEGDEASFTPANAELAECADRAEELYRTRPNTVRRAIIAANASSAAAFADAFKLRKD